MHALTCVSPNLTSCMLFVLECVDLGSSFDIEFGGFALALGNNVHACLFTRHEQFPVVPVVSLKKTLIFDSGHPILVTNINLYYVCLIAVKTTDESRSLR